MTFSCDSCGAECSPLSNYCHNCGSRIMETDPHSSHSLSPDEVRSTSGMIGMIVVGIDLNDVKIECKKILPRHIAFIQDRFFWSAVGSDAVKCAKLFGWKLFEDKSEYRTGIGIQHSAGRLDELRELGVPFCLLTRIPGRNDDSKLQFYMRNVYPSSQEQYVSDKDVIARAQEHADASVLAGEISDGEEVDPDNVLDEVANEESGIEDYHEFVARIRESYPNAWERWTQSEEDELIELISDELSVRDIAERMGRTPGAIRSRANKFGLEF